MPLVNRTFDQLIDFTRTSAATFVNSSGNIASTPQSRNLLTFTNEFANAAWTKTASTVTANSTTAPDGTMTADTLVASAGTSARNCVQTAGGSGSALTLSLYAKAGTSNFVQLYHASSGTIFANFNLATGAVGTVGAGATAAITSVGNGWYRCAITFTPGSSGASRIGMITSATAVYAESWTAAGTETIFIWGAQLEQASSATDYTRNFGGLFPPRFDYDPVSLAPRGLLIEEQRTNLLTYSEQFDDVAWAKGDVTVTANSVTSPDGTVDADSLVENTATATHAVYRSTGTLTGAYAATCYVKPAGRSWCYMEPLGNSATRTFFNLSGSGSIGTTGSGVTASISAVGNGWYRITTVYTYAAGAAFFTIGAATADATPSYAGNGAVALYLYGAQLEAGAFATSYIPTVASQVTRSADVAAIGAPNFASWYNQSEGTFFAEFRPYAEGGFNAATVTDGGFNNRIQVASANNFQFAVMNGGTYQALIDAGTISAGAINKVAGAYRVNDFAASLNNSAAVTDTSGTVPTLTVFNIGSLSGLAEFINGHIRSLRFYPVRLTNAQLQALTA